ncbi:MAG: MraY family glycosyltransferase [SAR324 cluster bacterium]|nr:MraY family glycosyltransferase [SAR324 cluster bacterium]
MQSEFKLYTGGFLLALLVSSILVLVVLHRLSGVLQSRRQQSLRDQRPEPVPRFGGIGIAGGFVGVVLLLALVPLKEKGIDLRTLLGGSLGVVLLGGGAACLLGFLDDLFVIRARYKFAGQVGVALLTVVYGPVAESVNLPFFGAEIALGVLAIPLTMLWIVGMMNALNLIDGMDGLAGGISMIALGFMALLAAVWGRPEWALVCLVLFGATLGFWVFNKPTATLFMGDSGSMMLGYLLAVLALEVAYIPDTGVVHLAPVVILAIPILDTIFALFRRYLKGIPFYSADRDHLHHRLLQRGLRPWQALMVMLMLGTLFGALGVGMLWRSEWQGYFVLAALGLAYMTLYLLEYEVVLNPMKHLRDQPDLRRRRSLMINLAEGIDLFLNKDRTRQELLQSYTFWLSLAGIGHFALLHQGRMLHPRRNENFPSNSFRELVFREGEHEVRLALDERTVRLDSDVKGELLDRVTHEFLRQYSQRSEPAERPNLQVLESSRSFR